jgi:hypothetical protein
MKSIIRRLKFVESNVNLSGIPEKERLIVIPFYTEEEFAKGEKEVIEKLKQKYGAGISKDDFLIVGIRKFYQEEKMKCES